MKTLRLFCAMAIMISGIILAFSCEKNEESSTPDPVAILTVNTTSGTPSTVFIFNASDSHDGLHQSHTIQYRWDLNGDGVWDIEWGDNYSTQYSFELPATYTVILEVMTTEGKIARDSQMINIEEEATNSLPVVATNPVFEISHTMATGGGTVLDEGGSSVSMRGLIWKINDPNNHTEHRTYDTIGTLGSFDQLMINLIKDTVYLVKAYAMNSFGISYGEELMFSTDGGAHGEPCEGMASFTDSRDGQVYGTVQMGKQCWMDRNMTYNTGINYCYENNSEFCDLYGRLYEWETAINVCPEGWRLPTNEDWFWLTGEVAIAEEVKSIEGWFSNGNGTNSSAFNAWPGGAYFDDNNFSFVTERAYFWSADDSQQWHALLTYENEFRATYFQNLDGDKALSVRCIKDN